MSISIEQLRRFYKWSKEPDIKECAKKAYGDLSRTLNYSLSSENIEKIDSEQKAEMYIAKERYISSVVDCIYNKIQFLKCDEKCNEIKEKMQKDSEYNYTSIKSKDINKDLFDYWHYETCTEIISKAEDFVFEQKISYESEAITHLFMQRDGKKRRLNGVKGKEAFSYGQAQKWLNITVKNMYIAGVIDDKYKEVKRFEKYFHVPIDNLIMCEASWEKDINVDGETEYKYGISKPWSQWGKNEYTKYQNDLREILTEPPIIWEFDAWIRGSKKIEGIVGVREFNKEEKRFIIKKAWRNKGEWKKISEHEELKNLVDRLYNGEVEIADIINKRNKLGI